MPLPVLTVCTGTGVGSLPISRNADGLPGFTAQLTGGNTLSEVHHPVLTANGPHLK